MTAAPNLPETHLPDAFRRLSLELLGEVTMAFFEATGVGVSATGTEVETNRRVDLPLGATISFVGDHARGTVALAPTEALAQASHPHSDNSDEDDLSDWVGEMANQILGRLKNRLLPHAVELLCDTPMAVCGKARLGGVQRPAHRLSFASDHGPLTVWLDVQIDDDIAFNANANANPGDPPATEGELVLF